jgi:hypothetical protein
LRFFSDQPNYQELQSPLGVRLSEISNFELLLESSYGCCSAINLLRRGSLLPKAKTLLGGVLIAEGKIQQMAPQLEPTEDDLISS